MTRSTMPAEIRQEHDLPFPVERVWRALTDPEEVRLWMADSDITPVNGHRFEFRDKPNPAWDGIIRCVVLDVEPPRRIVYSWQTGRSHTHRVSITLRATDAGTKLVLRHSGFQGFADWALKILVAGGYRTLFSRRLPAFLRTRASQRTPLASPPGA